MTTRLKNVRDESLDPTAAMGHPLHACTHVRLRATVWYNAILPANTSTSQVQIVRPSSVPAPVQPQRPPLVLPIDRNVPPPKALAPVEGDPVIDLTNLDAGLDDDDIEMDDLELTYPEPPKKSPENPLTTAPLPRAPLQNPLPNTLPHLTENGGNSPPMAIPPSQKPRSQPERPQGRSAP